MTQTPNSTTRSSGPGNLFQKSIHWCKPMILPILLAIVPTLYHYSNNVEKLTFLNLARMLVFNVVLAIIVCLALVIFNPSRPFKAANASFLFLVFFNIYGFVYRYLLHLDVIRIEHYTVLPVILLLAIYTILLITKLKQTTLMRIWNNLTWIVSALILINLIKIVPAEIKRWENDVATAPLDTLQSVSPTSKTPDIYYII